MPVASNTRRAANCWPPSSSSSRRLSTAAPPTNATLAVFDTGIRRQLTATRRIQLRWWALIVTQQATDGSCQLIAWFPHVDHEGPPTRPAKHQRGAQTGRASTHNDAFPVVIHPASFPEVNTGQTPPFAAALEMGPPLSWF